MYTFLILNLAVYKVTATLYTVLFSSTRLFMVTYITDSMFQLVRTNFTSSVNTIIFQLAVFSDDLKMARKKWNIVDYVSVTIRRLIQQANKVVFNGNF
jgi:hypothetical protein